jgi:hypothetical protein
MRSQIHQMTLLRFGEFYAPEGYSDALGEVLLIKVKGLSQ